MRVWYALMATFITLMIAMSIMLGIFNDLQVNHRATFSIAQMNDAYGAQGASRTVQKTSACPWQLDFITLGTKLGTKLELASASNPLKDERLPFYPIQERLRDNKHKD